VKKCEESGRKVERQAAGGRWRAEGEDEKDRWERKTEIKDEK
jgi:hypothetical protein